MLFDSKTAPFRYYVLNISDVDCSAICLGAAVTAFLSGLCIINFLEVMQQTEDCTARTKKILPNLYLVLQLVKNKGHISLPEKTNHNLKGPPWNILCPNESQYSCSGPTVCIL